MIDRATFTSAHGTVSRSTQIEPAPDYGTNADDATFIHGWKQLYYATTWLMTRARPIDIMAVIFEPTRSPARPRLG